jgi:hypothetical protein
VPTACHIDELDVLLFGAPATCILKGPNALLSAGTAMWSSKDEGDDDMYVVRVGALQTIRNTEIN